MPQEDLTAIILKLADTVGGLMELWGFKRALGRMWAVLYFSSEALSAPELAEELAMSTGAVSMTLGELQKWGVVKKTWRPGERRDYYEPETSIWKMVSRVFRERELVEIRSAIDAFESARRLVDHWASTRPEMRKNIIGERIEALLKLARIGETLLAAIIEGKKIDPSPIKTFIALD